MANWNSLYISTSLFNQFWDKFSLCVSVTFVCLTNLSSIVELVVVVVVVVLVHSLQQCLWDAVTYTYHHTRNKQSFTQSASQCWVLKITTKNCIFCSFLPQFHALQLGPSISRPAISCPAILMVRPIRVGHFQPTLAVRVGGTHDRKRRATELAGRVAVGGRKTAKI